MDYGAESLREIPRMKTKVMSRLSSFPPYLPSAFAEVTRLTREPEVSTSTIAELIERDPFLDTNVLCLANALYLGPTQKARTVREAFLKLGSKNVIPLLFAASVAKMVQESDCAYDLSIEDLWEHLVGTAIAARKLAELLKLEPPAYMFLAALTHDIGKIVLGAIDEVEAELIISLAFEENISFEKAEKLVIGIDHAEVGACLLEAWNLPVCLLDVVRYHHRPQELSETSNVVDLVNVADAICMMAGVGASLDTLNYTPSTQAMSRLGIGMGFLDSILYEVLHELMQVSKR